MELTLGVLLCKWKTIYQKQVRTSVGVSDKIWKNILTEDSPYIPVKVFFVTTVRTVEIRQNSETPKVSTKQFLRSFSVESETAKFDTGKCHI